MKWKVYIIQCSDDSYYTGITTDVARRLRQHSTGCGAKYFRGREATQIIYLEEGHDRSSASKREAYIKKLKRAEKELLISNYQPSPVAELKSGTTEAFSE